MRSFLAIVVGLSLWIGTTANAVAQVAISPDGKLIASGVGKQIHVKDVATQKTLMAMGGHTENVNSLAYAPNGQMLISGGADKAVMVWDTPTGKLILRINTGAVVAGVETDGKLITVTDLDKKKRAYEIGTGREVPAK